MHEKSWLRPAEWILLKKYGTASGNLWSPVTMNGRGPQLRCGRGGGRQAGGFPEAVPYFFSRIHIRCGMFQFFVPLPAECSCRLKAPP